MGAIEKIYSAAGRLKVKDLLRTVGCVVAQRDPPFYQSFGALS
ncbi:MAG: hypothetical protein AAFX46_13150 [Cyanobacteria bacterium J06636_27]